MNMQDIDLKLRNSFHFVQNDIIAIENKHQELLERIERVERILMRQAVQPARKQVVEYVGNRETREIHKPDCILARGMDHRNQIVFASKQSALQSGFSECVCLY